MSRPIYRFGDCTIDASARELGVSEGNLRVRVARARAVLRERLRRPAAEKRSRD